MNIPASDLELLFSHLESGNYGSCTFKAHLAADFENPSGAEYGTDPSVAYDTKWNLANRQLAILPEHSGRNGSTGVTKGFGE